MISSIYAEVRNDIKLVLTLSLSVVGACFLFIFGLLALVDNNLLLASYLLGPMCLGMCNMFLLKTKYKSIASINLAIICGVICLFLIAHGGKSQTGILWTYPLVTVAIAILRYRQGVLFSTIFLSLSLVLLYAPLNWSMLADYPSAISSRYLFSCLALCAISITLVKIQESMNEKLQERTVTDALTGLYNRGIIKSEINVQYSNQQTLSSGSLIMVDIDHFKKVNDEHGHSAGDKVLVMVSETLKSVLRSNDLAIRWGGEEFLIILLNCDKKAALSKAEHIQQTIFNNSDITTLIGRNLTLSIGMSELNKDDDLYESIKVADKNLYHAKNTGRNKIVSEIAGD